MLNHRFAMFQSDVEVRNMSRNISQNKKKQNPDPTSSQVLSHIRLQTVPILLSGALLLDDFQVVTTDLFQLIRLVAGCKRQNVIACGDLIGGNTD